MFCTETALPPTANVNGIPTRSKGFDIKRIEPTPWRETTFKSGAASMIDEVIKAERTRMASTSDPDHKIGNRYAIQ
ncbi:MAG: hypothetical protein CM1200mP18_16120 [Gammaproteobacteria bacterium]|nr:MAG: hypothetical protein CM1200mP18_16120 [Gammaproteobacteria bacterium]